MGRIKTFIAKKLLKALNVDTEVAIQDAGSAGGQRDPEASIVKRVGLRQGDITTKDFEDPEFDLTQIQTGYNADSYIRQGVDKYVDQIFKEGYEFYSKNEQAAEYIKTRLSFIAEATSTPTSQLFTEIAEDVVKYSNCFLAKVRDSDAAVLPPTLNVQGVGGNDPVVGYFCVNATTMKLKRDKNGNISGYQQEIDSTKVKFKPEDMIHFFYKREKGNAFGTPFLWPVLDDVRALRQAEENVLRMMYRNIHPFHHVRVGTDEIPGTPTEISDVQDSINNMDVQGGIVTTNRVEIKAIASDRVIDADPYLEYLEQRVFSGMGIPAILFGRGDTSNRSTGDNMTSEMSDRIKAMQRTIEATVNDFLIKELLLEGGYDPVLNPDDAVIFRFKENDMDSMIKMQTHTIYKFEHNAITEDEMRYDLGLDPITDRSLLNRELAAATTISTAQQTTGLSGNSKSSSSSSGSSQSSKNRSKSNEGSKETNNKQQPQNQHGTKTSPKKSSTDNSDVLNIIDRLIDGTYWKGE